MYAMIFLKYHTPVAGTMLEGDPEEVNRMGKLICQYKERRCSSAFPNFLLMRIV